MNKPEPAREHEWLRQLAGEWTFEHDSPAAPGEMPTKFTGTESVRMVGDVWMVAEMNGEIPGGGVSTSLMTLGYDPQKQRFVGTFLSSMMTSLWIYEGELDPAGRALNLSTEGPDFSTPGATGKYVDTIEIVSPDERLLISKFMNADGTWTEFMRATYRRRSA